MSFRLAGSERPIDWSPLRDALNALRKIQFAARAPLGLAARREGDVRPSPPAISFRGPRRHGIPPVAAGATSVVSDDATEDIRRVQFAASREATCR